jgi:hypothetical protein
MSLPCLEQVRLMLAFAGLLDSGHWPVGPQPSRALIPGTRRLGARRLWRGWCEKPLDQPRPDVKQAGAAKASRKDLGCQQFVFSVTPMCSDRKGEQEIGPTSQVGTGGFVYQDGAASSEKTASPALLLAPSHSAGLFFAGSALPLPSPDPRDRKSKQSKQRPPA